jgi:hypothetical protein
VAERDVLWEILVYLGARPEVFVYRVNVCPVINPRTGKVQGISVPKGHPDILACAGGRYIAIECKSQDGRQRPEQKSFQRAVERSGGLYVLARSVEDVAKIVG